MERLRDVLVRSHVAAVAVALLLLSTLDGLFGGVWPLLWEIGEYIFTTVAIRDIPYFSWSVDNRFKLVGICLYLYSAVVSFCAAWLLSRWFFDSGSIDSLSEYFRRYFREN